MLARLYQHHRERAGHGAAVCRNVKRWSSASMAMRWTAAAMQEAAKGFRRAKAHTATSSVTCRTGSAQTRRSAHEAML